MTNRIINYHRRRPLHDRTQVQALRARKWALMWVMLLINFLNFIKMIEDLINLMGRPIQDPEMKDFLAKNGFKYPKKDTISNRSQDRSFWLENKKLGLSLLFTIQIRNPIYSFLPGGKKGIFLPMLNFASFNSKSQEEFPFEINFALNLDKIKQIVKKYKFEDDSPPKLKWMQRWNRTLDKEKDIAISMEYRNEQKILKEVQIKIKTSSDLLQLYDELMYALDVFPKFSERTDVFFLWWAIKNDFFKENTENKAGIKELKAEKISIVDFVKKYLRRSYVGLEDFCKDAENDGFLNFYINNESGYSGGKDIYLAQDFSDIFLKGKRLDHMDVEGRKILNQLEFSEENYKKVESFLNQRYKEFKENRFKKSKKLSK